MAAAERIAFAAVLVLALAGVQVLAEDASTPPNPPQPAAAEGAHPPPSEAVHPPAGDAVQPASIPDRAHPESARPAHEPQRALHPEAAHPVHADAERACLNQKDRRAEIESGKLIRLSTAIHEAKRRMPGAVVRARLCHGHDGLVYVLTVLAHDGKVARIAVDAMKATASGER